MRTLLHTWPAEHQCLAWPQIALLTSAFHCASHVDTILQLWSDMLLLWLRTPHGPHPCACGYDLGACTLTPFNPNCTKRVPIDRAWAQHSIDLFITLRKWPKNVLEGWSIKLRPPGGPTTLLTPRIKTFYLLQPNFWTCRIVAWYMWVSMPSFGPEKWSLERAVGLF